MNKFGVIFCLLITSFTCFAQQNNSNVLTTLAAIETKPYNADFCFGIIETNKLIQMGDSAVDTLISALGSEKFGHVSKWSAAMALGEIGNPKALEILTKVAAANPPDTHNFYLGQLAGSAAAKLKGEKPKQGKFRKLTYGVQKTITDCETGESKVVP